VDAPVDVIARSLGSDAAPVFHRHAATHPWTSHAAWILSQMLRWGTIEKPIDVRALARRVYRPDLHREAAADVGLPAPLADEKIEAAHFDGLRFEPDRIVAYLETFAISALRVRLDELAELN